MKKNVASIAMCALVCCALVSAPSCKKPKPGAGSPPTTTDVVGLIPFMWAKPVVGGGTPYDRQVNYKAKVIARAGTSSNNIVTYGTPSVQWVNNPTTWPDNFPSEYRKNMNVPSSGFFAVEMFLELTECGQLPQFSFWKGGIAEFEGISPTLQLPQAQVLVSSFNILYQQECQ